MFHNFLRFVSNTEKHKHFLLQSSSSPMTSNFFTLYYTFLYIQNDIQFHDIIMDNWKQECLKYKTKQAYLLLFCFHCSIVPYDIK